MRTLASGLSTAQKNVGVNGGAYDAIWKIVLSRSGQTTRGYDITRVMQIQHDESGDSQAAQVLLDNSDGALTSLDFEQYQGIIYYGYNTGVARTAWAATTAYSVGDYVKPTAANANGYQYRCTVAGTSAGTEPAWGTALGVTQADSGVTWEMDGNLGDEYSPTAPLKSNGQEFISSQTQLVCRLLLIGLLDQLGQDRALATYKPTSSDTSTCKTLVGKIADASTNLSSAYNGYPVMTDTYDSEDSLLDVFYPADYFSISVNATRRDKLLELLTYTATLVRAEDDGELHFLVPRKLGTTWAVATAYSVNDYVQPVTPNNNFLYQCTTAGTSHATTEPTWPTTDGGTVGDGAGALVWTARDFNYEYRFEVATYHNFFSKNLRKRFVDPNRIIVASPSSHSPAYTGNATSATSYALAPKTKTLYRRLVSNASATSIAKAMIEQLELRAERGSAVVPMNCGQEVYDCVKFTDASQNDLRIGNILSLQRNCKIATDTSAGQYDMLLRFGDINSQNIGAAFLEPFEATIAPITRAEVEGIADNVAKWWMLQLEKEILGWLGNFVSRSGDVMTGEGGIDMMGQKVTGLAAASASGEAIRHEQVLGSSGLVLSGSLEMSSNRITGLAAGIVNGDAIRYEQLTGTWLLLSGGTMSGNIAMGGYKVTGLGAATLDGQAVRYEQQEKVFVFSVAGTLVVGTNVSFEIPAPTALTIVKVYINVKTAPTGASIIIDVNKSTGGGAATTIFTTQSARPEIAISGTADESGAPAVTTLAKNDILSIDVDQIGSTIAGADLTVQVRCEVWDEV